MADTTSKIYLDKKNAYKQQKILNTKTIVNTQNDGDWDEIEN